MITAEDIIKKFNLMPHPKEGGYFIETYRSDEKIVNQYLNRRYEGDRCLGTAIYFLLTKDTFSEMHRLKSDEIFHFYLGDPVEMLHLYPNGTSKKIIFGSDILNNMQPQVVVPKNVWQGARLLKEGVFALMGTTLAPGFEYQDYETGNREKLIKEYPEHKNLIISLTNL